MLPLSLASEDTPSIEGDLRIRENNSSMSDKLERAIGDSRFAPILHDNAAVTNHVCIRLPEESSTALSSTGDWLKETFSTEFPNDPAMVSAAETLAESLAGIAEHRNLELLLKVGWTEESSGAIYGGIQMHDNPQLLPSIYQIMVHGLSKLMAHPSLGTAVNDQTLELMNDGDMDFIRIILPQESMMPSLHPAVPVSHTSIWLTRIPAYGLRPAVKMQRRSFDCQYHAMQ